MVGTNKLALMTGVDIPFPSAQVIIHQPSMKEISYIGEESFFISCQILKFTKNDLEEQVRNSLVDISDFEVIIAVIKGDAFESRYDTDSLLMLFTLIFPKYQVYIDFDKVAFVLIDEEEEKHYIDRDNFDDFKNILSDIFCWNSISGREDAPDYNAQSERAKEIAAKLKKGREKAAAAKGEGQNTSIYDRFMSILSVGLGVPIQGFNEYTVYQLQDAFDRYNLKDAYDRVFSCRLAGAVDIKDPDNWMKDIHSKN